jgi:hypothetical protein
VSREPAAPTETHAEMATEAPAETPAEAPAEAPAKPRPQSAPPGMLKPLINRDEASMSLEIATSKEKVGDVLVDWLRSTFGCGLVLIVKNQMALGWKGFFPDAQDDLLDTIAMPVKGAHVFGTAYGQRTPFHGCPTAAGAAVHSRLWKLLRCQHPTDVLVCPILLGKRVVNLVYTHALGSEALPEEAVEDAKRLCGMASEAYARIIRNSK